MPDFHLGAHDPEGLRGSPGWPAHTDCPFCLLGPVTAGPWDTGARAASGMSATPQGPPEIQDVLLWGHRGWPPRRRHERTGPYTPFGRGLQSIYGKRGGGCNAPPPRWRPAYTLELADRHTDLFTVTRSLPHRETGARAHALSRTSVSWEGVALPKGGLRVPPAPKVR